MAYNLRYLKEIKQTKSEFGIELKDIAKRLDIKYRVKIALTLFEFFNSGKFIDEKDIIIKENVFKLEMEKYPNLKKEINT